MEQAQQPVDPKNLNPLEQKHWPQIESINPEVGKKFAVKANVGKIPHPMEEEHLIMWIEAFYANQPVGKVYLKPGDEPKATFEVTGKEGGVFKVLAFCNLHGLWQNEIKII